ncbi:hypothetical protein M0802_009847 [Mischocyttarus mexicanus]|nr:hypothetical protein M0802_009847 [Mischocyttarus mexicanus]
MREEGTRRRSDRAVWNAGSISSAKRVDRSVTREYRSTPRIEAPKTPHGYRPIILLEYCSRVTSEHPKRTFQGISMILAKPNPTLWIISSCNRL